MFSRFEEALNEAVAAGRIAGAVALVTDRDGEIYQASAGRRVQGGEAAMTPRPDRRPGEMRVSPDGRFARQE